MLPLESARFSPLAPEQPVLPQRQVPVQERLA